MKKVLITGINGFIGNAIKEYLKDKYVVYGIDIRGQKTDNEYIVDMKSSELKDILTHIRPDIIIHAAGGANVSFSVANPQTDFENSVQVFYNLLESMRSLDIHAKLIFLSSAAVYGNADELPIFEDKEPAPISPYGLHKKMCEEIGLYYKDHYGFDISILRIFSVYGPGLKKQLIWDMFQKYTNTGKIELFGTGDESRDYIYIDDLVKSIELIMNSGSGHTVYNIANGQEVTIREVAETFSELLCGENKTFFNNEVREGDPRFWQADISALRALGYRPAVNMKEGLGRCIEWAYTQQDK